MLSCRLSLPPPPPPQPAQARQRHRPGIITLMFVVFIWILGSIPVNGADLRGDFEEERLANALQALDVSDEKQTASLVEDDVTNAIDVDDSSPIDVVEIGHKHHHNKKKHNKADIVSAAVGGTNNAVGGAATASPQPTSTAIPWGKTTPTEESSEKITPKPTTGNGKKRKKARYADGQLRLVGGQTPNEGNVEVYHLNRWGAICDDEFDIREATVVCRDLGYSKAQRFTENSHFGPSRKRIWMDNLYCYGDEKNLTACQFDGWGTHDCSPREGAGVVCHDPRVPTTTTTEAPTEEPTREEMMKDAPARVSIRTAMTSPMQVRLVGGRVREEGRVEVRFGDGDWGLICGDGWGMLEAMVTCRMLGLGYAQAPVQSSFFGGQHLGVKLSGITCTGSEKSLADCLHDRMGWVYCPARNDNIAGIICTEIAPDLVLDYQEIERSAYLEDRQQFYLQCAKEENCLARTAYRHDMAVYGWQLEVRRLLRFTARSHNLGTADFRPTIAKHLWQWHLCHMHYHSMEVFAHFDIIDGLGKKVAEGHKASFCLEDNQCQPGIAPKYVCANYGDQGISVGCTDTYLHNVDCQWIDITDVTPGYYYFKISINPDFKIGEISYDNNGALCNLYYNGVSAHIWNCTMVRP